MPHTQSLLIREALHSYRQLSAHGRVTIVSAHGRETIASAHGRVTIVSAHGRVTIVSAPGRVTIHQPPSPDFYPSLILSYLCESYYKAMRDNLGAQKTADLINASIILAEQGGRLQTKVKRQFKPQHWKQIILCLSKTCIGRSLRHSTAPDSWCMPYDLSAAPLWPLSTISAEMRECPTAPDSWCMPTAPDSWCMPYDPTTSAPPPLSSHPVTYEDVGADQKKNEGATTQLNAICDSENKGAMAHVIAVFECVSNTLSTPVKYTMAAHGDSQAYESSDITYAKTYWRSMLKQADINTSYPPSYNSVEVMKTVLKERVPPDPEEAATTFERVPPDLDEAAATCEVNNPVIGPCDDPLHEWGTGFDAFDIYVTFMQSENDLTILPECQLLPNDNGDSWEPTQSDVVTSAEMRECSATPETSWCMPCDPPMMTQTEMREQVPIQEPTSIQGHAEPVFIECNVRANSKGFSHDSIPDLIHYMQFPSASLSYKHYHDSHHLYHLYHLYHSYHSS